MISTIGAAVTTPSASLALPARGGPGAQRQARGQRPVARRHARVVHDLAAAAAQLRLRAARSRARGRSPTCAARSRSAMRSRARTDGVAPGPFLRGAIVAAAVATGGRRRERHARLGPRPLGGGARRPAAARRGGRSIARIAYPRLLAATATALGLMLAAIATGGLSPSSTTHAGRSALHVAAAGASLAASLVALVLSFRGEPVPLGPWRDYITLTKPRIMSLLLLTGAAGMFVGAEGWPGRLASCCDDGRARARLRRLERAQPRDGRRHRQADGRAHRGPPGCLGSRRRAAGARVRRRPDGPLVRAARDDGERAHGGAGARRRAVLRRRLHRLPQALDRPEHRHRRCRRRRAAARRLRRRDREPHAAGALAVPDRLPLDAAALLGARADDQGALRRREHADAAGHARATARRRGRSSSTRS